MKRKICLSILTAILLPTILMLFPSTASSLSSDIDLTTLTPSNAVVGWGELCVNKDLGGEAINIEGQNGNVVTYSKGLVAHANSRLEYDISKYTSEILPFSAYVGADKSSSNTTPELTSMIFTVEADGKKIYQTSTIGYTTPAVHILCAIPKGTKTLALISDGVDNWNMGDHCAWGSPKIEKNNTSLKQLKEVEILSQPIIRVNESRALEYNALNYLGESFDADSTTFSSSNSSVLTVSSNGNIKGVAQGTATVTVTAKHSGITASKKIEISVIGTGTTQTKSFTLSSPQSSLKVNVALDSYGAISYTVKDNKGKAYLESSFIGINTSAGNFSNDFKFVSATATKTVKDSYDLYTGKTSHVDSVYNETVLTFSKSGYKFDVTFRVYDDGFGYRYNIKSTAGNGKDIDVIRETGTFKVPENSTIYAQFIEDLTYYYCYEQYYRELSFDAAKGYIAKPALFKIADEERYILISEADLYSESFAGSVFEAVGCDTLELCFAPRGGEVTVEDDFTSPWRYGICGSLETLIESNLTENLNPPAAEGDYSWVKPGISAWSWLAEGGSANVAAQGDPEIIKKYIDFAAEMGWEYFTLDEGWLPDARNPYSSFYSWFPEVAEYAKKKGVGLIAWVYTPNVKRNANGNFDLSFIKTFAQKGIKGIKIDFFDSESQYFMDMYKQIYDACGENKILVNCHGANIPTGERRTYPFVINREAVRGEEYGGGIYGSVYQNAMFWAYLRGNMGPMDITPALHANKDNSTVFQMAVNIMFECSSPCMISTPEEYREFSQKSFYQNLPTVWDETQFISGTIGKSTAIARRSGNTWYLASMSNEAIQNGEISLDFLDDGKYFATIYEQGETDRDVTASTKQVTASNTLKYSMNANSAYLVKLVKVGGSPSTQKPSSPADSETETNEPNASETLPSLDTESNNTDTQTEKIPSKSSGCFSSLSGTAVVAVTAVALIGLGGKRKHFDI